MDANPPRSCMPVVFSIGPLRHPLGAVNPGAPRQPTNPHWVNGEVRRAADRQSRTYLVCVGCIITQSLDLRCSANSRSTSLLDGLRISCTSHQVLPCASLIAASRLP
jgi:hypothetical protein